MTDFVKNKNYDNVYLRDLYSALSYFFIDVISLPKVSNGILSRVPIPIIPSFIGSEQFLRDFFVDINKVCCGKTPSNVLSEIPSGRIIGFDNFVINDSLMLSDNVRTKREVDKGNMFIDEKVMTYNRDAVLGLDVAFNVEFKLATNLDRMKLFQEILDNFHKERSFYFSSCGIHKIPCSISINNSHRLEGKKQFKFGDFEGYYSMNVSFNMTTFYVSKTSRDSYEKQNLVDKPTVNITS